MSLHRKLHVPLCYSQNLTSVWFFFWKTLSKTTGCFPFIKLWVFFLTCKIKRECRLLHLIFGKANVLRSAFLIGGKCRMSISVWFALIIKLYFCRNNRLIFSHSLNQQLCLYRAPFSITWGTASSIGKSVNFFSKTASCISSIRVSIDIFLFVKSYLIPWQCIALLATETWHAKLAKKEYCSDLSWFSNSVLLKIFVFVWNGYFSNLFSSFLRKFDRPKLSKFMYMFDASLYWISLHPELLAAFVVKPAIDKV